MLHCTVALDRVSETCPRKLVFLPFPFFFLNHCGRSLKHFSLAAELDFAVTNGVRDCFIMLRLLKGKQPQGYPSSSEMHRKILSRKCRKKKVLQVPVDFFQMFFVHMYLLILFLQYSMY